MLLCELLIYDLEVEYFALIIGYRLATIDILLVGVSRDEIAPKC